MATMDEIATTWEGEERKREENKRKKTLIRQYGSVLGKALAESSLDIGSPVDKKLAIALLSALTSDSQEQRLNAILALLAYARESGRDAASSQSSRDNAVY